MSSTHTANLHHAVAWLLGGLILAGGVQGFGQTSGRTPGTVVSWGNQGLTSTVPNGLNGVVAIAAGAEHGVALKQDGTLVVWGYNVDGQTTVPAGLRGVVAVAARDYHSGGLKQGGAGGLWGGTGGGGPPGPGGFDGGGALAA